jgi:hypothetical protein
VSLSLGVQHPISGCDDPDIFGHTCVIEGGRDVIGHGRLNYSQTYTRTTLEDVYKMMAVKNTLCMIYKTHNSAIPARSEKTATTHQVLHKGSCRIVKEFHSMSKARNPDLCNGTRRVIIAD